MPWKNSFLPFLFLFFFPSPSPSTPQCSCNCENPSKSPRVLGSKHNPAILRIVQRVNLNATLTSVRLHLLVIPLLLLLLLQFMVGSPYPELYSGNNENCSLYIFNSQGDESSSVWPVKFSVWPIKQGKTDKTPGSRNWDMKDKKVFLKPKSLSFLPSWFLLNQE